jgi:hypothetical protein
MSATLFRSPTQLVATLLTRAHHAEQTPRKPLDRKEHDARIRDTDDEIKRCLWAFGCHAGVEL